MWNTGPSHQIVTVLLWVLLNASVNAWDHEILVPKMGMVQRGSSAGQSEVRVKKSLFWPVAFPLV